MHQASEVTSFAGSPSPLRGGRDYLGPSPCRRLYRCADGWIALNAATGGPEALTAALAGVVSEANVDVDVAQIEQSLAGRNVEDALDTLAAASIAAVKVLGRNDIFEDGWLEENNFFAPVEDTDHGRMSIVTGYADWGRPRADQRAWSHALGEDAATILTEAGLPADAIRQGRS
jgi:crotonobetainyl-CoA:carnitine CoA-transferase CaiB-like acyl-CoA transferase